MDGCKYETEEKMSYRRTRLVKCWYVLLIQSFFFSIASSTYRVDYLQARLTLETSQPAFSELPFRFAEVAKVILDVLVLFLSFVVPTKCWHWLSS